MLERAGLTNPTARRGFILLALMQFAFGFALNAQQNIVTNYFAELLPCWAFSPSTARSWHSCAQTAGESRRIE